MEQVRNETFLFNPKVIGINNSTDIRPQKFVFLVFTLARIYTN